MRIGGAEWCSDRNSNSNHTVAGLEPGSCTEYLVRAEAYQRTTLIRLGGGTPINAISFILLSRADLKFYWRFDFLWLLGGWSDILAWLNSKRIHL